MEYLNQQQKIDITLSIAKKLKFYETPKGGIINLWNNQYTFIPKIKEIFKNYIYGDIQISGELYFEEIGKYIEYRLPVLNTKKPLFVIRIK